MKTLLNIITSIALSVPVIGQTLVSDYRPGMDDANISFDGNVTHGEDFYFRASETGFPINLCRLNGQTGTISKLTTTSQFSIDYILGIIGNDVLFWANDFDSGIGSALYKTDLNLTTYSLVTDINNTNEFLVCWPLKVQLNNLIFFYAQDEVNGYELWRTDGTSNGTFMVKDINPNGSSLLYAQDPENYFAVLDSKLIFGAGDVADGAQLWISDGTEQGTYLLKDIFDNTQGEPMYGSNPSRFCTVGNKVYFSAFRQVDGRELWVTDGTEQGTQLVKDLAPGDSYPEALLNYNGTLYFKANSGNDFGVFCKSDGTVNGTGPVILPLQGGPDSPSDKFVIFKGKIYMTAYSNTDNINTVFYSDGTANGTHWFPLNANLSSNGVQFLVTTNYLYFTAINNDGDATLYRTDGTNGSLTELSTTPNFLVEEYERPMLANNCIYFVGNDQSTGYELYKVCNQATGPVGLEELTSEQITVYPNPNQGSFTLKAAELSIQYIRFFSLDGSELSIDVTPSGSGYTIALPAGSSPGMYILQCMSEQGTLFSRRVMIR